MGILDILGFIIDTSTSNYNRKVNEFTRKLDRQLDDISRNKRNLSPQQQEAIRKEKEKLSKMRNQAGALNQYGYSYRRTDRELHDDPTDAGKKATDFQIRTNIKLKSAISTADSKPGVYILYLNGQLMKCGRAAYSNGVRWRLRQYYDLTYDNKSRRGDYWAVSIDNRDDVEVSWQCCPVSKCQELEYKLFRKYGKGPWAERAPSSCTDTGYELLI